MAYAIPADLTQAVDHHTQLLQDVETSISAQVKLFEREIGLAAGALFEAAPSVKELAYTCFDGEYNDEGPYPGVLMDRIVFVDEDGDTVELEDMAYGPSIESLPSEMQEAVRGFGAFVDVFDEQVVFRAIGTYSTMVVTPEGMSVEGIDY